MNVIFTVILNNILIVKTANNQTPDKKKIDFKKSKSQQNNIQSAYDKSEQENNKQ